MSRQAFLHAIHYRCGATVPMESWPYQAPAPHVLKKLRTIGYGDYSHSDESAEDLFLAPIIDLQQASGRLASLDSVAIAQTRAPAGLAPLLKGSGARNIELLEFSGLGCGDIIAAIIYGALLVRAGRADNVLCCTSVKIEPGESRIIGEGDSFAGDGAACCIVSSAPGPVTIVDFQQAVNLELRTASKTAEFFMKYLGFSLDVFGALSARLGPDYGCFDHYVGANIPLFTSLFVRSAKGRVGAPFTRNVAKIGRIPGSELLINLENALAEGVSGRLLLGGLGLTSVSMVAIEVR